MLVGSGVAVGSGELDGSGTTVGSGVLEDSVVGLGAEVLVGTGAAVGSSVLLGSGNEEGESPEAQLTANTTTAVIARTRRSADFALRRVPWSPIAIKPRQSQAIARRSRCKSLISSRRRAAYSNFRSVAASFISSVRVWMRRSMPPESRSITSALRRDLSIVRER